MVRKAQVEPTTVNVERGAEVFRRHGRALDVPTRATAAPGGLPRGGRGLPRLGRLPQGEVTWIPFAHLGFFDRVGLRLDHDDLVGELAVLGPTGRIEIHVAVATRHGIGVTALHEQANQVDHFGNAGRGTRFIGRRLDAQGRVGVVELALHAIGQRPPLFNPGCASVFENLVVDVGHVAHERHVESFVREPPAQLVVNQRAAQMPDVRARLHGRTTDIHAHFALDEGHKVAQLLRLGIEEADGHRQSLPTGANESRCDGRNTFTATREAETVGGRGRHRHRGTDPRGEH